MIDTDKYEGPRTEGPWKYIRENDRKSEFGDDYRIYIVAPPYGTDNRLNGQGRIAKMLGEHTYYDAQLIADAPLLLAEVKRLQSQYEELKEALIGDSPNWTHDEVVEQALELATLNHNDGDRE